MPEDVTVRGTLVCARGCISLDAPDGDASFGGGNHLLSANGSATLAGGAVTLEKYAPPGIILDASPLDGGLGYEVGDVLTVGTGAATVRVQTVDDTEGNEGAILSVSIEDPASGYTADTPYDLFGGAGAGAILVVAEISEVKGDLMITHKDCGLILKSPNGSLHRVRVANDGTLSTEAA